MEKDSRLPPRGDIEVTVFDRNTFIVRIKRDDGKELGVTLSRYDMIRFIEYCKTVLYLG